MTRTDRIKLAICIGVIVAIPVGLRFFVRWDRQRIEEEQPAKLYEPEKVPYGLYLEPRGTNVGGYAYLLGDGPFCEFVWTLHKLEPPTKPWEPSPVFRWFLGPAHELDRLLGFNCP